MTYATLNGWVRVESNQECTEVVTGQTDFKIRDQKHRAIGYVWNIHRVICTPIEQADYDQRSRFNSHRLLEPGMPFDHYEVRASVTRNGERYGASHGTSRYATLDEANRALDKRVEASRKSYSKKFGSFAA